MKMPPVVGYGYFLESPITRVSQENLADRIVAINGYPFCEKQAR